MRRGALLALAVLLVGCAAPTAGGEPPPDPDRDRLGWEAGYWHDEALHVDESDGLDADEREAVVARAMARVERIRNLEFEAPVPVAVVDRDEFDAGALGGPVPRSLRAFDNAKFEALFLVGSDEDSLGVQNATRNRTVAGYYDPDEDAIVVVSDARSPSLEGEGTLAHELVHALQDQHFEALDGDGPGTRDGYNARNGLVEGDARVVQRAYVERCGDEWACIERPASDGSPANTGGDAAPHLGIQVLEFFPYSDGPDLVAHLRERGGWAAVDEAYASPPETSTAVIYPERYGSFSRRNVTLSGNQRDGWERVRPPSRPDHARLGQSALAAMFAYTLYDDYNRSAVVDPAALLNRGPAGELDGTDPLNYDLPPTRGWVGDRLHAYRRGSETAFVWRLAWASPAAAERFGSRYRALLAHWGGDPVAGGTWAFAADSPFDGAVHLSVDGATVTITGAPDRSQIEAVSPGTP